VGLGIDTSDPTRPKIRQPRTAITNITWQVFSLITAENVRSGTTFKIPLHGLTEEIFVVNGSWEKAGATGTVFFYIPTIGTPNEEKIGDWKIIVYLDGLMAGETAFTMTRATTAQFEALKKALEPRLGTSAAAHFQLGAAASLFGQDDAPLILKKGVELAQDSLISTHMFLALGRHYAKRGLKQEAVEAFLLAKDRAKTLPVSAEPVRGWFDRVIGDHLKQLQ